MRGLQLWQPGRNIFRLRVLWIKFQRSLKVFINFKNCSSPQTSKHTQTAVFANLAKVFAWSRKTLRIGKKRVFQFLKIFFHKLFPWTSFAVLTTLKVFSAIVPNFSKFIQKSLCFQDFLSETLLCKCSSGHVKSRFDNPAKIFPLKLQVFLVEVQKWR